MEHLHVQIIKFKPVQRKTGLNLKNYIRTTVSMTCYLLAVHCRLNPFPVVQKPLDPDIGQRVLGHLH